MQIWIKSAPRPTRIGIVLFDRFSNLCLANCLEPLRAANTLTGRDIFSWQIFTLDGASVRSSSRLQLLPQAPLSQLSGCDYLYVLVSYDHAAHDTPGARKALRAAARKAGFTVGFDAAPWLLASAGLLDGRRATLHWDLLDAFGERFLRTDAERSRVVRDGPVITCAGAMSALDLSLDLISTHAGVAARLDVEALFIQGDTPAETAHEARNIPDPLVRKALELMRDRLENPISVTALSRLLSCQPRTLGRRCRAVLGASPGRIYRHLRLSSARNLLEGGQLGIAEVAVRCGYDSPAALSRAIRRQYAATPSDLRRAARMPLAPPQAESKYDQATC